jgi:integrase
MTRSARDWTRSPPIELALSWRQVTRFAAAFQDALKAAGVEGHVRTFHDMRQSAITNLAATGASPIAVMATAGHRSMETTKGYLHSAGVVSRHEASALEERLLVSQEG